ncbi:MAG: YkgJ family cysteine cluster protein [Crenarchaeota archaeon]|nr:YkgJ family cysteine cluster protein [Thermoproteota archaeon]
MPLTRRDIERIERLGYPRDFFAVRGSDGVWRLRNVDGHCVFLDPATGRCRIYPHRPEGCRLYPLVYDAETGSVTVDPECPRAWMISEEQLRRLAPRVIKLVEEIYGAARG